MRLFVLVFCFSLFSCGTSKVKNDEIEDRFKSAEFGDLASESEDYKVMDVRIERNRLILTITFSGGCTSTEGKLIANESIMKSMPPKRAMKFILKKEGACRKMNQEQFIFNIANLAYKQEKGSEIILLLEGYDTPLKFVYH